MRKGSNFFVTVPIVLSSKESVLFKIKIFYKQFTARGECTIRFNKNAFNHIMDPDSFECFNTHP